MKTLTAVWPLTGDYGHVLPGISFDVDDETANQLIERGLAVEATEESDKTEKAKVKIKTK